MMSSVAIPDLVYTRFNRVNRELADLKSDVAEIKDRVSYLETKVDALPAIMAEVIRDELKK